jgi:dolichyl-phosphate beta-glucosyltransferase
VVYLWLLLSNNKLEGYESLCVIFVSVLTYSLYEDEKYFYDTNHILREFPVTTNHSRKPNSSPADISLSVIIPAYNEEKRLGPMMNDCLSYLKTRESLDNSFTYEIIIVNDGRYVLELLVLLVDLSFSTDNTSSYAWSEWVSNKNNKGEYIRIVTLKKNRGKGGALKRVCICSVDLSYQ